MKHTYETSLENHIKDNRAIAEFMQATNNYWYASDSLTYHSSWNMLMPVVCKINAMGKYFCINIDQDMAFLHLSNFDEMQSFNYEDYGGTIGAVYRAVVEFITWFNAQPKD